MIVAAIQTHAGVDIEKNVRQALDRVEEAADAGARFVALPEYFSFYGHEDMWGEVAHHGFDILAELALAAKHHAIYLLAGSTLLPTSSPDKVANESVLFDPHGNEIARYRKIHLFDVTTSKQSYRESDYLLAGEEIVTAPVDNITVGLAICFDLRFPLHFRTLRKRETNVIAIPSAFTEETGIDHWEPLLRARAIETQCYVIAPALWSPAPLDGKQCHGNTMIIDPWGKIMNQRHHGEGFITAEVNLDTLYEIRENIPLDFG